MKNSPKTHEEKKKYPRFRLAARIEHAVLMFSFTLLAVTGLPQKYAIQSWAENMINFLGGIEQVRVIHRYAAFVFVLGAIYHLFTSAYRFFVKREKMAMIFVKQDARDFLQMTLYNLGIVSNAPKMPKFNFGEKFEYWALVWGTVIMVLTGFMLWNPIIATMILPGQFIPVAKAAHGGEAVLAVLTVLIWHMYSVLLKNFNVSIFTGDLTHEQMEDEHALELERLKQGGKPWPELDLPVLQRRRRIFIVVSAVLGVLILVFTVWAFNFEQTAITTIPRVTPEIFVPLTTPSP